MKETRAQKVEEKTGQSRMEKETLHELSSCSFCTLWRNCFLKFIKLINHLYNACSTAEKTRRDSNFCTEMYLSLVEEMPQSSVFCDSMNFYIMCTKSLQTGSPCTGDGIAQPGVVAFVRVVCLMQETRIDCPRKSAPLFHQMYIIQRPA